MTVVSVNEGHHQKKDINLLFFGLINKPATCFITSEVFLILSSLLCVQQYYKSTKKQCHL